MGVQKIKLIEIGNKEHDIYDLENLKLMEIIALKGDIDMIYGDGAFEQSVGEDASKLFAMIMNLRRSSDMFEKITDKEGNTMQILQHNILEGNVDRQQRFIKHLANQ